LLVDTGALDAAVLAAALSLIIAVSVAAALLPGRWAARVDPAAALRWE
jgi:ABC-type lipoprotein release transport system permease subunit